tara:strand:- start:26851 stop:27195 length:345 start_codon:yes stop_codon:yes gene_type:complete
MPSLAAKSIALLSPITFRIANPDSKNYNKNSNGRRNQMDIEKSLRHYMDKHQMTQADIVKTGACAPATISLIINKQRGAKLETVQAFAEIFNVPVSEFIKRGETNERQTPRTAT